MNRSRTAWISAMLVAASALAACRSAPRETPLPSPQRPATSESDLGAMARARADSIRHPYTAADVRFMSHMIGHHAQAIEMSRLASANGGSATVRTLAERIINAQEDEIAIMQQWLRDRRQPVLKAHSTAMPMHHGDHVMAPGAMMPGMLTAAQMNQLVGAKGTEFDRLFLTFMIQHHRGAIAMVEELFGTLGAAQNQDVFKLASDVNVDQSTEVARMTQMLAALIFERPPR